jgi:hypothetical protein
MEKPQRDTGDYWLWGCMWVRDRFHLQILKTCKPYRQIYWGIFVSFNTLTLDTYRSFKIKYGKLIEIEYFTVKTPKAGQVTAKL